MDLLIIICAALGCLPLLVVLPTLTLLFIHSKIALAQMNRIMSWVIWGTALDLAVMFGVFIASVQKR